MDNHKDRDEVTGLPAHGCPTESAEDPTGGIDRHDGRFRLGIAGYDLWPHAVNFCDSLRDAEFAKITAVWDEDPRHVERLVEITGAAGYTDLHEFCASDLQGAIITARTSLRRDVAVALAAAGKHVLSDKPMAMTAAECKEIIANCDRAGVALMGGYNFRFWKVWPLMKKIMDSGELGRPAHFYCAYNTGMIPRSEWEATYDSDWTNPAATPGGGWFTHGDHAVDLARWLFDTEFVDVVADMRKLQYPQYGVEDYGVAHFGLQNGATALIHSDATTPGFRLDVVVTCEHGGMSYAMRPDPPRLRVWGAQSAGAATVEYVIPETWVDALRELTRAFVSAIETRSEPPVTGMDNLRVMEVVDATYRSAAQDGFRTAVARS